MSSYIERVVLVQFHIMSRRRALRIHMKRRWMPGGPRGPRGEAQRGPREEAQRGPVRPGLVDGRGREAAAGRAGNGCKLQINRRLDQNILRGANDAL